MIEFIPLLLVPSRFAGSRPNAASIRPQEDRCPRASTLEGDGDAVPDPSANPRASTAEWFMG